MYDCDIIFSTVKLEPTLELRKTLGRLRSINPSMINHFANQSKSCQLLNSFNIEKKLWNMVQSRVELIWINFKFEAQILQVQNSHLYYLLVNDGNVVIPSRHMTQCHYEVKTTSFWRHNDVVIASCVRWVLSQYLTQDKLRWLHDFKYCLSI